MSLFVNVDLHSCPSLPYIMTFLTIFQTKFLRERLTEPKRPITRTKTMFVTMHGIGFAGRVVACIETSISLQNQKFLEHSFRRLEQLCGVFSIVYSAKRILRSEM